MSYLASHPGYRPLTVETGLCLVEPRLRHASASLSWVKNPDVVGFMGVDFDNPTLEGEEKRIKDILKNADEYSWMIELSGAVIGNVCINAINATTKKFGVKSGNLTVLIGDQNQWKKGIGVKVCSAILAWAFGQGGFEAMAARALQENVASIRTLQKLGFQETGKEPYEGLVQGKKSEWINFTMHRHQNHRPTRAW